MKITFCRIFLLFFLLLTTLGGAEVKIVTIGGKRYMESSAAAKLLRCNHSAGKKTLMFAQGKQIFSGKAESSIFIFNGVTICGILPIRKSGKLYYISELDVNYVLSPLLNPVRSVESHPIRRILIDPGHGGPDKGASGLQAHEKNITLSLARRVAEILRRCSYEVWVTRLSDKQIPLNKRAEIARRIKADLFISIHCNAAANKGVSGIETYCMAPSGSASTNQTKVNYNSYLGNLKDANNFLLAYEIHKAMLFRTKADDRSVKHSRFAVLRGVDIPGVLIEAGFISNEREEKKLSDPLYREHLAKGIATGIITYHSRMFKLKRQ